MAFAVRDGLPVGGRPSRRGRSLPDAPADHIYMAYVGVGWAMARVPRFRWASLSRTGPAAALARARRLRLPPGVLQDPAVRPRAVPGPRRSRGRRTARAGTPTGSSTRASAGPCGSSAAPTPAVSWPGLRSGSTSGRPRRPVLRRGAGRDLRRRRATRRRAGAVQRSAGVYRRRRRTGFGVRGRAPGSGRASSCTHNEIPRRQVLCGHRRRLGASKVTDEALVGPSRPDGDCPGRYELWRQRIARRRSCQAVER